MGICMLGIFLFKLGVNVPLDLERMHFTRGGGGGWAYTPNFMVLATCSVYFHLSLNSTYKNYHNVADFEGRTKRKIV